MEPLPRASAPWWWEAHTKDSEFGPPWIINCQNSGLSPFDRDEVLVDRAERSAFGRLGEIAH